MCIAIAGVLMCIEIKSSLDLLQYNMSSLQCHVE